jgi:Na+-translocating ferredoxin:NAD+ oxidoreductase RnfA subunit
VALLGWVLVRLVLGPWHLEYLRTPALVAIVLIVVPLADLALLLAFAALYERLQQADVPAVFREAPLALITAGIMALAFMGFSRLIQE